VGWSLEASPPGLRRGRRGGEGEEAQAVGGCVDEGLNNPTGGIPGGEG